MYVHIYLRPGLLPLVLEVYISTCIYVYMCICIYIYIHIYIFMKPGCPAVYHSTGSRKSVGIYICAYTYKHDMYMYIYI